MRPTHLRTGTPAGLTPAGLTAFVLKAVVLAAVVPLTAACDDPDPRPPGPAPPALGWSEATVPVPPGPPGRIVVRTATVCDGRWYLGGAVATPAGDTRPAVWSAADGRTWEPLAVAPLSYYGKLNVFYTIACRDGVLAAVGAKSGGVHGNPRVSSWRTGADTVLTEVLAAFTLYGGSAAVNVSRLAAGRTGFMIAGNRVTGPAVWTSPDAQEFTIHEAVPPLANADGFDAAAADVVATGAGWTVVGGATPSGRGDRDPAVWTSSDGVSWNRTVLPGDAGYEELQRVTVVGPDLLAVGLRGGTFGAWRQPGGASGGDAGWQRLGTFGATRPAADGTGAFRVASVLSVAAHGTTVLVTVSDGRTHRLFASPDGGGRWAEAPLPAANAAGADRATAVAAGPGGRWLYLSDDADAGRVWTADAGA